MPHADAPVKEWSELIRRLAAEKGKWKKIKAGGGSSYLNNSQTSKKIFLCFKESHGKKPNDLHLIEKAPKK